MDSSLSLTCDSTLVPGEDFVAPVRSAAAHPSFAGFLLGATCAALLVFGLAGGTLFLSHSFVDSRAPSLEQLGFNRVNPPVLSLDFGPEALAGGTLG